MKRIKLTIDTPERLDKAIVDVLGFTRSKIQKAIKLGSILVDGKQVAPKFLVSSANKIEYDPEVFKIKKTKHKAPDLNIIFENDDVIVVNKPAGLIVHETETSDEPTLVDGLIKHDKKIQKIGQLRERAGLVHRLDKAASGILIVAKTDAAFEHLKLQFHDRLVTKHYSVLVRGTMEKPHDTIKLPISRAKSTGRMAAKPPSQGGKVAITHYDVVKQYPHHALLDVNIETGRTHQIRAHMYAIEHPVVGDTLYRQKGIKPMDIGRIFLHARELTITLPDGEEHTFTAPIPKELKNVLETIPKI